MSRAAGFVAALFVATCTLAQPFRPPAADIPVRLSRLADGGKVLMIAAHPDDEVNGLLAYLALGRHVSTEYLSLTRGEGGQNVIGSEKGRLLGTIRTQELEAARRIDGATQSFTSAVDFGYSKTAEETLKTWDRNAILGDIVERIRSFKPDVIILRWTGTPKDGHGHHQASAILGKEAFSAAADPTKFPERGAPWQAKRLMTFSHQKVAGALELPIGQYNAVLGYSYAEIGSISRSQHHSQAMGAAQTPGAAFEYLINTSGVAAQHDPMEGISEKPSDAALALLKKAIADFRPERAFETVPVLLEARKLFPGDKTQLDEVIAECAGLYLHLVSDRPHVQEGQTVNLRLEAVNRSQLEVAAEGPLPQNVLTKRRRQWVAEAPVRSQKIDVTIAGQGITLFRPIEYRYVDRVFGQRSQPIAIVPPVSVAFADPTSLFASDSEKEVRLIVKSYAASTTPSISLRLPAGWHSNPERQSLRFVREGEETTVHFRVTPGKEASALTVQAMVDDKPGQTIIVTRYPHIPTQTSILPAEARFVRSDIRVLAKTVGYVEGAGDEVPDALRQLGCSVTFLTTSDLTTGDLDQYDVIVTGVRAFNVREDLRANIARLNEYVHKGGGLIVQYTTAAGAPETLGPFPIKLSSSRISVEEAPVKITNPASSILNYPNRISLADFDGWVQERGLYFPSQWDPRYQTGISSNDPGEPSLAGGILFTKYGEGAYIYTSYSWFRQLPAGVPGAYRIFANMLSQ